MARPPQRLKKTSKRPEDFRTDYIPTLIVCEGETEKNYFKDLKREIRHTALTIKHTGTDPVTLVQDAGKLADNERIKPENVWCVFDGEEHKEKFNEALQMAEKMGFKTIYSNPCFERWYILHFSSQNAPIDRKKAEKAVQKHSPGWKKPKSLYHPIKNDQPTAITRAQNGRERQISNGNPEWENPSTKVDLLVTHLNEAKKAFDGK